MKLCTDNCGFMPQKEDFSRLIIFHAKTEYDRSNLDHVTFEVQPICEILAIHHISMFPGCF